MADIETGDLSEWDKLKGTVIGISAVLTLVSAGYWLRVESSSGLLNSFTPLFISLFIGTLVGHYIGKSIIQKGELRQYVTLGVAVTATGWWLYSVRVSALTAVLLLAALSLILSHDTEFIREDDRIEKLIEGFAENVSPAGLTIYAFFKLLVPYVPELTVRVAQRDVNLILIILGVIFLGALTEDSETEVSTGDLSRPLVMNTTRECSIKILH